ncbi:MAG: nucleoid-associated protein [Paraglaciecola sp.]|uniref:nucleoid-associated protein n=1 Tax=Paraglaciecola sp. TaxID=1920173 RepID=UPI0032665A76
MNLLQTVIHELIKEPAKEGRPAKGPEIVPASEQLDVTNEPTVKLVESIKSLYGSKGNYSSQGSFDIDDTAQTFPINFSTFIDSSGEDELFLKLTLQTMDNLVKESRSKNFATGGYIVFAHYEQGGQNFFLVAMVKKKDGITLVNLKPETIQEVDLSKLHQAIRINISSYLTAMEYIAESKPTEGAYLSFISPVSNQGASGYFISAFGCSDAIAAKVATESAFAAVTYYFDSYEELRPLKSEANDITVNLFNELLQNEDEDGRICTLELLDEKIQALLVSNNITEMPESFSDVANREFVVPASFYPNKSAVTEFTRLKLKGLDGAWTLNFEKRVFGTDNNSDIQYVRPTSDSEGAIIIRHLSPDLIKLLNKEAGDGCTS